MSLVFIFVYRPLSVPAFMFVMYFPRSFFLAVCAIYSFRSLYSQPFLYFCIYLLIPFGSFVRNFVRSLFLSFCIDFVRSCVFRQFVRSVFIYSFSYVFTSLCIVVFLPLCVLNCFPVYVFSYVFRCLVRYVWRCVFLTLCMYLLFIYYLCMCVLLSCWCPFLSLFSICVITSVSSFGFIYVSLSLLLS